VIERRSAFQRVVVGVPGGFSGPSATRSESIVQAFRDAGAEASVSPRIEIELWNKLAFLASMAAACGLSRAAVGAVRSAPLGALLIERAVAEVVAVAAARGISLGADATERTIAAINALPSAMRPSLLLDLERGGPTEVDVLSGAIARMGRTAASAYKAGLRVGDIVKTFNGTTITDAGQLYRLISDAPVGSTASLGLLREGQAVSVKVPIERPPSAK
jgi:2-dehydropantoate 2-reductase